MTIGVGSNGFGRRGRRALRAARNRPKFEIVPGNETRGGATCTGHLAKFDTVHGQQNHGVAAEDNALAIDGTTRGFSGTRAPPRVGRASGWTRRCITGHRRASTGLRNCRRARWHETGARILHASFPKRPARRRA